MLKLQMEQYTVYRTDMKLFVSLSLSSQILDRSQHTKYKAKFCPSSSLFFHKVQIFFICVKHPTFKLNLNCHDLELEWWLYMEYIEIEWQPNWWCLAQKDNGQNLYKKPFIHFDDDEQIRCDMKITGIKTKNSTESKNSRGIIIIKQQQQWNQKWKQKWKCDQSSHKLCV